MYLFKAKLISTLSILTMLLALPTLSSAQELNLNGFSGYMNTTVTSGVTIRAEDNNCQLQDGYKGTAVLSDAGAATFAGLSAAHRSIALNVATKNEAGCATARRDGYGNLSAQHLAIGNVNNDDGKLNFPNGGDIIDATQKAYTEITGTTDSGLNVGLSFIGSYNPVLEITKPAFRSLTSSAEDEFESDLQILDAYISGSADTSAFVGADYIDYQVGRFVTSWGEATFIPIGMNGFVTNALDITKLRAPGSSIRDALIPTEQLTFNVGAGDVSIEAYYQFSSETIKLDPKGAFYGSDVAGTGATSILASGSFGMENNFASDSFCTYAYNEIGNAGAGNACDIASAAEHYDNPDQGKLYQTAHLAMMAQTKSVAAEWKAWTAAAAAVDFGATETGGAFSITDGLANFTTESTDANAAYLADNVYTQANIPDFDWDQRATVEIRANSNKFVDARNDGQYGIALRTYLDDVGDGLDLSFHFANYHSKIPYAQIVGKGGVLAGDHVGMYIAQFGSYAADSKGVAGRAAGDVMTVLGKNIPTELRLDSLSGTEYAGLALLNGAMSSGVCGGFTALSLAPAYMGSTPASGAIHQLNKNAVSSLYFGSLLEADGKVYDDKIAFNATKCDAAGKGAAASTLAYIGYGATLLPAITPLNLATYQFVYPEDIQALGVSFNTNVNGTTIQGEVTYRPDFPLATLTGDQINAISDASGSTAALSVFAAQSYGTTAAKVEDIMTFEGIVNTVLNGRTTYDALIAGTKRSSLATPTYSQTSDYAAKAYHDDMDVWSFDIGTTTAFNASHPVTQGLGADSVVLLTELGIVNIDGLDNRKKGFVARNGFNEGSGEHLCLGAFQDLTTAEINAINTAANANATLGNGVGTDWSIDHDFSANAALTNMGASIVDALFGNGSYCESNMGASATSATYRVITSATYNNFNNTNWTMSPSMVWAHDFSGYGPASLGGFVEGKQSLSLGLTFKKGSSITTGLNYVAQMGDITANTNGDKDYLSANISYAF